jgi:NAD(P)H-hydrate epimerase
MYAGDVEVVDIGVPDSVIASMDLKIEALDGGWAHDHLPLRRPDAHKGDCGHVLVVGGSPGLTGAVALASRAAMRAGAGLVTAAVPRGLNAILEMKLTEPMTTPLDETEQGAIAASAEADLLGWIGRTHVLLLGPGMARVPETEALARRLVLGAGGPVVLDADGLNAFEGRGDELARAPGTLIITPHPGEMARLSGVPVDEQERDRIGTALAAAGRFRCIVVYKGAPTVIAGPDGRAFLNPTGNAGMATGGSGDVLSGIIAGLLAQGCAAFEGAALGVYLHGLAGDLAARQLGIWSLIAGDMIEALPDAMVDVWKNDEGPRGAEASDAEDES